MSALSNTYTRTIVVMHAGQVTTDLGGGLTTTQFTDEVIHCVSTMLEV